MTEKNSIFDFGDKFGYESPFKEDWVNKEESERKEREDRREKERQQKSNYVRLLLYGGARKLGDNSVFEFASKNVAKDYPQNEILISKFVDSAQQIIDIISMQKDSSIQSIDLFTHGSSVALFLIKGASLTKTISEKDVSTNNLNAGLYASKTVKTVAASYEHKESSVINNIDYAKFTDTAKIEIHGCNTGAELPGIYGYFVDNICENLSSYMYGAGKKNSVVIGHTTQADPMIKGANTKKSEQDYRWKERAIYHNGNLKTTTTKKGKITKQEIDDAIKK